MYRPYPKVIKFLKAKIANAEAAGDAASAAHYQYRLMKIQHGSIPD